MSFSFFFSSRRRHTRCSRDWSSDVCSSDLFALPPCALGEPRTDRTCGSREHKRRCVREVCESAGPPRPSRRCSCIRAPNHSGIRRRRAFWRQALRAFGGATSSVRWFCPSFVHLWEPPVLYGGAERL